MYVCMYVCVYVCICACLAVSSSAHTNHSNYTGWSFVKCYSEDIFLLQPVDVFPFQSKIYKISDSLSEDLPKL